jgi:hypothetical protein
MLGEFGGGPAGSRMLREEGFDAGPNQLSSGVGLGPSLVLRWLK